MALTFNHTIVHARSQEKSSAFLAEMLGLPAPSRFGPFHVVALENGVSLDFIDVGDYPFVPQHYAFLIGEDDFDVVFGRIRDRGLAHWADPGRTRAGEINHHNGGRGVYFDDPDGHLLEIMTRPYSSDPSADD